MDEVLSHAIIVGENESVFKKHDAPLHIPTASEEEVQPPRNLI
jgi:hypothetical protein